MKYRAVWKPGSHPRRGMGSLKAGRKKLKALKPRGTVPGKGAETYGAANKKAA